MHALHQDKTEKKIGNHHINNFKKKIYKRSNVKPMALPPLLKYLTKWVNNVKPMALPPLFLLLTLLGT